MAEQLSKKALTVYQALLCAGPELQLRLAASIEALADQVVPADPCGNDCCITQCEQIRSEILAIAAELRGQDQPSSEERY